MVRTRNSAKSIVSSGLYNDDILTNISQFLHCRDLASLHAASKSSASAVESVASSSIAAANARYDGDEDMSVLRELNFLRSAPLAFDTLFGANVSHVANDNSLGWCAPGAGPGRRAANVRYATNERTVIHSSNPNTLHTAEYLHERIMVMGAGWDGWDGMEDSAICSSHVMTGGKHYARFRIRAYDEMVLFPFFYARLGVMRPLPLWADFATFTPVGANLFHDLLGDKSEAWGTGNVHACLYDDFEGRCLWSDWRQDEDSIHESQWEGMEGFIDSPGDEKEVGLLLDLDEGTLAVYKNGRRLGVMKTGLTGEYVWVATVLAQAHGDHHQQRVYVERAPIPGTGSCGSDGS